MKKLIGVYTLIWGICLAIFNAFVFITPDKIENLNKFLGAFWVGYAFISLAFVINYLCALKVLCSKNITKTFYNLPIISISYTGLVLMMIAGSACMAIPNLPNWIGIIVCFAIVAFNVIAIIKASAAADIVKSIDNSIAEKTFFIKALTIDADTLVAYAKAEPIKSEFKKVYEAIRYSDPMSSNALKIVEEEISNKFTVFSEAVKANDAEKVTEIASDLLVLIEDRNQKCKLFK